jgi:hypothetical protein
VFCGASQRENRIEAAEPQQCQRRIEPAVTDDLRVILRRLDRDRALPIV